MKIFKKRPLVLIIFDGLGIPTQLTDSPWELAQRDNFLKIEQFFPFTVLQASGLAVGLPWGEPGNSEVGHLTIGSGRVIYNHLPRIINAIQDGSFFKNSAFLSAKNHIKQNKTRLHLLGLFSSGSVHSYAEHLYALLDFAKREKINKVYLHLFTDGRDAPLYEGAKFIKSLEQRIEKLYPQAKIASLVGRRYAMDRDGRWKRIEKTYKMLTVAEGNKFKKASSYLQESYQKGLSDEFIEPAYLDNSSRIQEGDAVIFFNYREDSARELTAAFVKENFREFPRQKIQNLFFVTMTEYDPLFPVAVAFPPLSISNPLSKIISQAGLKQLHVAETEKYAHVTYFFNGGHEEPFEGEERILIPSPAHCRYDEKPEMSAYKITEEVIQKLPHFDFILVNFANADMVGHTGNFKACLKAIGVLNECLGKIVSQIIKQKGICLATADHGNIEEKFYRLTGEKKTNHTRNPVPFYLITEDRQRKLPREKNLILKLYSKIEGTLTDIAPTILNLLGLEVPEEMTGKSLLKILSQE